MLIDKLYYFLGRIVRYNLLLLILLWYYVMVDDIVRLPDIVLADCSEEYLPVTFQFLAPRMSWRT